MHWLWIILMLTWPFTSGKRFGLYKAEYEYVTNFLPENDMLRCHFRLSRLNRNETQVTATFEVLQKVVDLRLHSTIWRKTPIAGYIMETNPYYKSFCVDTFYPILKKSLHWKINKTDCSLEVGKYEMPRYSMDEEIRNWLGNKTFYGHYKTRVVWIEGVQMRELCGTEWAYVVGEVWDGNSEKSAKKHSHRNSTENITDQDEDK